MNALEFNVYAEKTKKFADNIRDIETLIAAKKSSSKPDVFFLEQYKEAVIDLFMEESKLSRLPR
jgi:hypothetical protein